MHVHIVLCCGVETVLFTNKLTECWCHIINSYLFTKFQHLGKRVTQLCMFTLFFVVVRKGYHPYIPSTTVLGDTAYVLPLWPFPVKSTKCKVRNF